MDFSNARALVTGAASGIGFATAKTLAEMGAQVFACDLNQDGAEEAIATSSSSQAFQLNVTDEVKWDAIARSIDDSAGGLDILVNAAGMAMPGAIEDLSTDNWRLQIDINLTGTYLGCRAAFPLMVKGGNGGSIINVSSVGAVLATADSLAYTAAKAGVLGLTRAVAMDGASRNPTIRCNAIQPGYVDTPMMGPLADAVGGREALAGILGASTPVGEVCKVEDIVSFITFLASPASRMITGASMPIDGGLTIAGEPPNVIVGKHLAATSSK